jgi:hypothetical protein
MIGLRQRRVYRETVCPIGWLLLQDGFGLDRASRTANSVTILNRGQLGV